MRRIACVLTLLMSVLVSAPASALEKVYFYYTDPAGTPVAMTNDNGAVAWRAEYKPFGETSEESGPTPNGKKFVGKEMDAESGLYYFGARYMEARVGRFFASDPVGVVDAKTSDANSELLADPQKVNCYAYGLNNPYRYVDPDGKFPWAVPLVIIAAELAWPQVVDTDSRLTGMDWIGLALGAAGVADIGYKTYQAVQRTGLAARGAPQLGSKLEYFLGRATGSAHNVERSTQMLQQLERIGLPDNPATRQYLTEHLTRVLGDPSSIARVEAGGRVVRESLLMGPRGGLKLETIWEGDKLITGTLFGHL